MSRVAQGARDGSAALDLAMVAAGASTPFGVGPQAVDIAAGRS